MQIDCLAHSIKMFFVIIWYSSGPLARFSILAIIPITVCRSSLLRTCCRRPSGAESSSAAHALRATARKNSKQRRKLTSASSKQWHTSKFKTAYHFNPDVDFIINIRGQDKVFQGLKKVNQSHHA